MIYDFVYLKKGIKIPTKLNPLYWKTLVSVVIPSYNDLDYLDRCLASLKKNSYYKYELIIINNGSKSVQEINNQKVKTKEYLSKIKPEGKLKKVTIVNWKKNKWVNSAWNLGAEIASGQYVAIINSDIEVPKDWDKILIGGLNYRYKRFAFSSPYEINPYRSIPYSLPNVMKKEVPYMIKGPCFVFRKIDVPKLFPIPRQIKHWCGDNVLADRGLKLGGSVFMKDVVIYHAYSASGRRLPRSRYLKRIQKDIREYQKWSGKKLKYLQKILKLS
jgi:glycosyltransferase involved in cell wall biosynthesis